VNAGVDMRSVPAVYDVDADGSDELICTSEMGLHVFDYNGGLVWFQQVPTGMIAYEYAFPNPVVAQLKLPDAEGRGVPDSGIIYIDRTGQIWGFRFNGDSYQFTEGGRFASMDPRLADFIGIGGNTSPFVTATDLGEIDSGTTFEVVAGYSSPAPYTGIGVFRGFNGAPKFDPTDPVVERLWGVFGVVLADLTGDLYPEIIAAGYAGTGYPGIWVKTLGEHTVSGWPVSMPEVNAWIASYPTAADLDLDGIPEILMTFFEFDRSALYIFRADGTPYVDRSPLPPGQAFTDKVTFGTPIVANVTGDDYPEIIFRSGYLLPGTGPERVYILDNTALPIPGWPIATPARSGRVFSSRYAPLVDDVDNDGLVELVLISDGDELLVWNLTASSDNGKNTGRYLMDNTNSSILQPRVPTTIDDDFPAEQPDHLTMYQNYPNPFNPETSIRFELPKRGRVTLSVYNLLGQQVRTLVDKDMPAGRHEVSFDGSGLATGVYFYRLKIDNTVQTRKMLMIK
jgi:hypothetical protein